LHAGPAQVEVSVFETKILVDRFVGVHLERGHLRPIQHFELGNGYLDVTGREPEILRAGRAAANGTADPQHVLVSKVLGLGEARMLRIEDDLGDSFMIAEVDENQATVIAAPIHPPVEPNIVSFVGGAQRAARDPLSHCELP
jgi:hypothetical protein